jgi:hypothetical protein
LFCNPEQLIKGESLGPDPNDVANNHVHMAPGTVTGLPTTIEESDELEEEDEGRRG